MSYSFSVREQSKAAAKDAVAAKLAEVVASQPIHKLDQDQAHAAASTFIDLLPDDDARDIAVSVNGSVSWYGTLDVDHVFSSASVGVSASLVSRTV